MNVNKLNEPTLEVTFLEIHQIPLFTLQESFGLRETKYTIHYKAMIRQLSIFHYDVLLTVVCFVDCCLFVFAIFTLHDSVLLP